MAVALPSLILLLALLLGAATAGLTQLRLEEAARAGAREVVRGETADQVQATVRRLAGSRAQLQVSEQGVWTTVTVGSRVSLTGMDFLGWDLSASATARAELRQKAHGWPYRVASVEGNEAAAYQPRTGVHWGGCPGPSGRMPTAYAS